MNFFSSFRELIGLPTSCNTCSSVRQIAGCMQFHINVIYLMLCTVDFVNNSADSSPDLLAGFKGPYILLRRRVGRKGRRDEEGKGSERGGSLGSGEEKDELY